MKKTISFIILITITTSLYSQLEVFPGGGVGIGRPCWIGKLDVAEGARIGNITSLYHSSRVGKYGSAKYYTFDPNGPSNGGLIMEQGNSESAGLYVDGDFAVIWSPGDQGYLLKVIDEDGMNLKWYVNGNGYAYTNSDAKRKENILPVKDALSKIKNIDGVSYNMNVNEEEINKLDSIYSSESISEEQKDKIRKKNNKKELGFIAQNVEKEFPEMVETDDDGNKYVNYDGMLPVLVECVKEQQEIIENQNKLIEEMRKKMEKMEKDIEKLTNH